MFRQAHQIKSQKNGFTIIELLIVMTIIGLLASLTVVNLISPQQTSSLTAAASLLVTDLRAQQVKAMSGSTDSVSSAQPYGIYFANDQYTLYTGSAYSGNDASNFVVAPEGVTFSTTFASSQVNFQKASGETTNYNASANTITVSNSGGQSKTITINRYGVVTVN